MSTPQAPRKEDVPYSTVAELGRLLRTRKMSCKELTLVSKPVGDAIDVLRKAGQHIQEIKLPDLPYAEVTSVIQRAEACAAFWPIIRDGKLNELSDEGLKTSFAAGVNIRAIDCLQANRMRAQIEEAAKDITAQVDVIVAPALPIVANKLEEDLDRAFGQVNEPLGPLGNLLGWPALSVPCGLSSGLPIANVNPRRLWTGR